MMIQRILLLRNHAGFRRYFKNTAWMMGEQILRIIAGLFVGIWVARYLGPEQFGIFSYVLAFTAIFGGIAKFGLDDVVVCELVKQPDLCDAYLGTAFWLKFIGAVIVIGLIGLTMPFISNDTVIQLYIFIIAASFIFQSFEVIGFYFQSQVLSKNIAVCKIAQLFLSSLVKICLVLTQSDLIWFVSVAAFDTASLSFSYIIAYKHLSFLFIFKYDIAKKLLKSSVPMMLSTFLIAIYMKTDALMIRYFINDYAVGIYSVGVKMTEAFYFLGVIITASIYPALISSRKISVDKFYNRMQSLYTIMVWLAAVIAFLLSFFSRNVINFMYGTAYAESHVVLSIYSWVLIFVFLSVANDKWFYIENRGLLLLAKISSGAVVNVVLNFLLIPFLGISGAAISALVSFAISVVVSDLFISEMKPLLKIKLKAFFPIYLISKL